MDEGFGVRGRLEDGAAFDQTFSYGKRVGQIAVVGNGKSAKFKIRKQRLNIAKAFAAGGGVPHVANSTVAWQAFDYVF